MSKQVHELSPEELKKLNAYLQRWAARMRGRLRTQAKGSIQTNLTNQNKYRFGLMEAIGFKFPRHGVFVEMGVFGGLTKKEAIAQNKLNPKPWFNPAMDRGVKELQEGLADITGDLVINAANAMIKNT